MGLIVTSVGLEKKSGVPELKKHAATIHCSNTLSLLQRKISNALLYHAYKELLVKEEHEITVKQLCKLIGYQGNNHAVIKEALKELLSTVIEWNVVSDTTGAENWTASSILASVSLQGPLCFYAYSPRMKQLLHSPSMFGKINLIIQSQFKSSYGLALYENCVRYRGLPYTKWFEMDIFRKLMGVPYDKYTVFRDFKKRVLDKSVEEVNTYSDIIVEPDLMKEGRKVIKIRFSIKERAKRTRLGIQNAASTIVLRTKLEDEMGLTEAQIDELMKSYSEEFIIEKVRLIESSENYQKGKIKNVPAYFISAVQKNYQPSKSSRELKKTKQSQVDGVEVAWKEKANLIRRIRESYSTYREEVIDKAIDDLSQEERDCFFLKFRETASVSIQTILKLQRRKYNKETVLHSPQIKVMLRQFALEIFPHIQSQLMSIETFVQGLSEKEKECWMTFSECETA